MLFLALFLCFLIYHLLAAVSRECRYIPGDEFWPAVDEWNELNETVGGRLIALTPETMLGAVCHDPQFNETACNIAKNDWEEVQFQFTSPSGFMMPYLQNQSCDPFTPREQRCVLGNYADYSINVTGPADVAAGVRFASEKNVRLVIKNTGHDYLGKSTGQGSLSLWTYNLKSTSLLSFNSTFYTGPAIKLGAGIQAFDAYAFANENSLRLVGGECPTVGIAGGYTTGGGHSALSSIYGLGADQTLSWEVVIANGSFLVANRTHNTDLYWALSGGGGGTYGVVISMTVKAYPDGPVGGASLAFASEGIDETTYWNAVEAWHASLPDIVDTGAMAIYSLSNASFTIPALTCPGKTAAETKEILDPFLGKLESLNITAELNLTYFPTYYQHVEQYWGPLPFGLFTGSTLTTGRLIPRAVVLENNSALTAVTREISGLGPFSSANVALNVDHAVAGNSPGSNSVLPAWREALISITVLGPWNFTAPLPINDALETENTNVVGSLLKSITPGGGTYMNEADFDDPDWKEAFFGENYDRLRDIKDRYDPDNLFYAKTAVGSDVWVVDGSGRLCKIFEGEGDSWHC